MNVYHMSFFIVANIFLLEQLKMNSFFRSRQDSNLRSQRESDF